MQSLKPWILLTVVISLSNNVQSKSVYNPELQRQISQHKEVATWEEAKAHCEREDALLASPLNKELLKYMKFTIELHNHTTPYFIGIKARHTAALQFISEEGVLLEDLPEALDMVEQLDVQDGECLSMDGHSIRVIPCWSRLPYMCYSNETVPTSTEKPTTTPRDNSTYCGSGYKLYMTGSYYKFHHEEVNWETANATCTAEGAYLAVMNNSVEVGTLKYLLFPTTYTWPTVWLGVRDLSGNFNYTSVHGVPIAKLYNVFTSSSSRSKSNCIGMRYPMRLSDWHCSEPEPFLCEKSLCV